MYDPRAFHLFLPDLQGHTCARSLPKKPSSTGKWVDTIVQIE
jgi:hypothetical protein